MFVLKLYGVVTTALLATVSEWRVMDRYRQNELYLFRNNVFNLFYIFISRLVATS